MFGNTKKQKIEQKKQPKVDIQTIPDVFYGGKDPGIYHHAVPTDVLEKKVVPTVGQKKKLSHITHNASQKSIFSRIGIWIGIGVLVIIGGIGISWYYIKGFQDAREQNNSIVVEKPIINETEISSLNETETSDIIITTTTTSTISTDTVEIASIFLEFPSLITLNTEDIDADELTDIEEEIFKTDSGTWDSDGDGYYDGQEVVNLYNPQGFAPVKIIDSGLVQEYINPAIGYRVYYPATWQMGSVDIAEKQILFSAVSGDYIEIQVVEKDIVDQTFITWFGRYAEGQRYTDVKSFTNRFENIGYMRKDDLVAYFDNAQYVVIMIYHPRDKGPVAYRHTMRMMYQSFRMQQTNIEIPDQIIYPGTTSTDNITLISTTTSDQPNSVSGDNIEVEDGFEDDIDTTNTTEKIL